VLERHRQDEQRLRIAAATAACVDERPAEVKVTADVEESDDEIVEEQDFVGGGVDFAAGADDYALEVAAEKVQEQLFSVLAEGPDEQLFSVLAEGQDAELPAATAQMTDAGENRNPPPPVVPPVNVNRGGRPRLERPDVHGPVWRVPASAVESTSLPRHTLGQLLNDLLRHAAKHNLSQAAVTESFELWRTYLPGTTLPHARQAREMVETDAPTERQEFAICSGDCSLRPLDRLTPEQLNSLRQEICTTCGHPLVENKTFVKVSKRGALPCVL
jgi:hypothetical protein